MFLELINNILQKQNHYLVSSILSSLWLSSDSLENVCLTTTLPSGVTITLTSPDKVVSSPSTSQYAFGLLGVTTGISTVFLFSEN